MDFGSLIEQLLSADGSQGSGYYYSPYVQRPRVARIQRPRRNNDELLRQLLLRQYLGDLLAPGQGYGEEEDEEDVEEQDQEETQRDLPTEEEYKTIVDSATGVSNADDGDGANAYGSTDGAHEEDHEEQARSAASEPPQVVQKQRSESIKVSVPRGTKDKLISPPLNLYEFEKHYIILLALAGVDKSAIDVDFHTQSNELVIKGQSVDPYLSGDADADSQVCQISELKFGSFQRHVKLPHTVGDQPEIRARFTNGLLEIKVLKNTPKQPLVHKITLEDVVDDEFKDE